MSEDINKNNDNESASMLFGMSHTRFVLVVMTLMSLIIAPQVASIMADHAELSSKIREARETFPESAKYFDEFRECSKRPMSQAQTCVAAVVIKYADTQEEELAKRAFRVVGLLPPIDATSE